MTPVCHSHHYPLTEVLFASIQLQKKKKKKKKTDTRQRRHLSQDTWSVGSWRGDFGPVQPVRWQSPVQLKWPLHSSPEQLRMEATEARRNSLPLARERGRVSGDIWYSSSSLLYWPQYDFYKDFEERGGADLLLMLEIETEIAVAQEEKKLAQDTHLQLCEMHNSTLTCDFMSKLKKKTHYWAHSWPEDLNYVSSTSCTSCIVYFLHCF